jgi:plasmid stabilization system protein ParE
MRIEFHPEARAELDSSAAWYADRSAVAVRGFLVAVDVAIRSVAADPGRFAKLDDRHRRCAVPRFPFQIVFRADEAKVVIVAIAHARRRPGYWQDRSMD